MRRVGVEREAFSSDAVTVLHEASAGRLRDLDRLASASLEVAARRRVRVVDRDAVVHVLGDHSGYADD